MAHPEHVNTKQQNTKIKMHLAINCLTVSSPMAAPPWLPNCQPASRGRHSVERSGWPQLHKLAHPMPF